MRIFSMGLLLMFAVLTVFAVQEDSAAQLVERAQSAPLEQQPDLYLRAAAQQLRNADTLYNQGKIEEAGNDVHQITDFADKAADAAIRTGKKLKNAEIEIRKIATRLTDIQRTLSFDDQATVKSAAEHLEDLRTKLLARMFAKDKKK